MTSTSAPDIAARPSYKWWVVAMLWLISFFNYADRQAIFSVFPLLGLLFFVNRDAARMQAELSAT